MLKSLLRLFVLIALCMSPYGCREALPDYDAGDGGSGGNLAFDPCVGRACGEICPACDINDPKCIPIPVELFCDSSGSCVESRDELGCGLCDDVVCEGQEPYCEGDVAYGGSVAECAPETGQCEESPAEHPRNCAEESLVCREGDCVPLECTPENCVSSPASCEGNIRIPALNRFCHPESGACLPGDIAIPGFDCWSQGQVCRDGECVPPPCTPETCAPVPPRCVDDVRFPGEPRECDAETGECVEYEPEPMIDCAAQDQVCRDADCVDAEFDPCAGRACGQICPACDINDPECIPIAVEMFCNAVGECIEDAETLHCEEPGEGD